MNQTEALVWSLGVEVPVVVALTWGRSDRWRLVPLAFAATLLTHPFAIAAFRGLTPYLPYPGRVVVVESLVSLAEAALYWRLGGLEGRRALAVGVVANAASYLCGLALRTWT